MKLLDSIIEFEKVFGRSGHDIGTMQINITSSESCNLETLYDILNFSKPLTIGGELFMHIYPKDMLDKMQQGWYWVCLLYTSIFHESFSFFLGFIH